MALGARAADLVRLTLGRSVVLVAIGLGTGVAAALVATRVMSDMLYGVAPNDPATFIAVPLLLARGRSVVFFRRRGTEQVTENCSEKGQQHGDDNRLDCLDVVVEDHLAFCRNKPIGYCVGSRARTDRRQRGRPRNRVYGQRQQHDDRCTEYQ